MRSRCFDIVNSDMLWIKELEKDAEHARTLAATWETEWTRWSELAASVDERLFGLGKGPFQQQQQNCQEVAVALCKRTKTTSNDDWASSTDEDARITRMKNGTTRLAYKAEHVIDMETGVILAAEVLKGNEHDAGTLESSLTAAEKNLVAAGAAPAIVEHYRERWHKKPIAEVVADKGYHKASVLLALQQRGYRSFIPEKKQRGRRKFTDKGGQAAARAFHANRARTRRRKGKEHQRRRGELLERPNQHLYDRGDLRELTVTGQMTCSRNFGPR